MGEDGRLGDSPDGRIVALAGAEPQCAAGKACFGLEAYDEIADFILAFEVAPIPAVCD